MSTMQIERFPRSEERLNSATHTFGAVLGGVGLLLVSPMFLSTTFTTRNIDTPI
jgi:hypothetical protein